MLLGALLHPQRSRSILFLSEVYLHRSREQAISLKRRVVSCSYGAKENISAEAHVIDSSFTTEYARKIINRNNHVMASYHHSTIPRISFLGI